MSAHRKIENPVLVLGIRMPAFNNTNMRSFGRVCALNRECSIVGWILSQKIRYDDSTNKMLMHNAKAHASGFIHKSGWRTDMLWMCSMNIYLYNVRVRVRFTYK